MKFIHNLKGRSPICKIVYKLTSLVNKQIGIGNSHFRLEVVSSGNGDGQFSSPCDISIKGDVLFVADSGNHRVQKLTSSGKFLHSFGQNGSSGSVQLATGCHH